MIRAGMRKEVADQTVQPEFVNNSEENKLNALVVNEG